MSSIPRRVTMMKPVLELEKILLEEKRIYEEIFALEENKGEAIMVRKGPDIESISREQEFLLDELNIQERKRSAAIDEYIRLNKIRDLSGDVTLADVIRSMDEDSSHHLMLLGLELKTTMLKLKRLQDTNEQLIRDNMEFFQILLSGLKDTGAIRSGYDRGGREDKKVAGSLLFNKTA